MRLMLSRKWRTAAIAFGFVVFWLAGLVWWYERPIFRRAEPFVQNLQYRTGPDPLLRDLASGTLAAGTPVEAISDVYDLHSESHGEFVTYRTRNRGISRYVCVIAYRGKAVAAWDEWICGGHFFFDTLSQNGWNNYTQSREDHHRHQVEARAAVVGSVAIEL